MERKKRINNAFYDTLHEKWLTSQDHPIALLRAENKARNPWIIKTLASYKKLPSNVLDIGCGAGLLLQDLAMQGCSVTGIDLSENSLEVAKTLIPKGNFLKAPAESLPFPNASFDIVCAMDLLEHVEDPKIVIKEAARVLKKDGLFFFHTFNRNLISYLVIIKGVDWFVKNAPKNMHVYPLFIRPKELSSLLSEQNLQVKSMQGLIPNIFSSSFWKMLFCKKIDPSFSFKFSKSLTTGYVGFAKKIF